MQFASGMLSIGSVGAGQSAGGIAFWAHAAGFVAGLSGVVVFRRPERQRVEWWHDV
jgi:membrane associated rhomboid family serine protease